MEIDVVRISVGPWNGRYSSVWRVWSNPGSDDIYLGDTTLTKYLKISLHQTGKFRAAFTSYYSENLVELGKDVLIDRAFLKWEKKDVFDNEIMQALDIHFPLSVLSMNCRPATKKGKKLFFMQVDEKSLGNNDSVTAKILFHKLPPESKTFSEALREKEITPVFWVPLIKGEYVTVAFRYSKILPLEVKLDEEKKYASLFRDAFLKVNKEVGDTLDDFTLQIFLSGRHPAIYNLGGLAVCWKSQKHFSIDLSGK